MNGMLLHLDEELTNNRPGHSYNTKYEAGDLAFWIQLYSLFYDRVLVPANFLTDSNLVPDVLRTLRVQDRSSLLRQADGPFQIVWDEARFPYRNFVDMVTDIELGRKSDVGLRDLSLSKQTAAVCDKYLSQKVSRLPAYLGIVPSNDASIRLMRDELFSPLVNTAMKSEACERLRECLDRIEEKGGAIGYGRNFYYTIFGYGTSPEAARIARPFTEIVKAVGNLRHAFLMAVDYASNTVKAQIASEGLDTDVGVLLPSEYQQVFRRAHTDSVWKADYRADAGRDVPLKGEHTYLVDREHVVGMTAAEFAAIRSGGEYERLRGVVSAVSADVEHRLTEEERIELSDALDKYLWKIGSVLNPAGQYLDRPLRLGSRICISEYGYSVVVVLGLAGALGAEEPLASLFRRAVEVATLCYRGMIVAKHDEQEAIPAEGLLTEGFQLGRGISVRLLEERPK